MGNAVVAIDDAAAEFGLPPVGDMLSILSEPSGLNAVRNIIKTIDGKNGSWKYELSAIKLMPPIPRPRKILGVALNYHDFCKRGNLETPDALKVFAKMGTTVIGTGDLVRLPLGRKVTYEGELAVVMGRVGKNIPKAEAFDYIAGYSILNDLTANDVAKEDIQLMRAKNYDTFCPMGPTLVTKDEIEDPYSLSLQTTVNGNIRQDSVVGQLIFKIPDIIHYFSSFLTLEPGDVIATGTPAGTALQHTPPAFLAAGDVVSVTINQLGTLTNKVV